MLPVASTKPLVRMLPPVTLPTAENSPAVVILPPVILPEALMPLVDILPPVMLPVALTVPPVATLPPVIVPAVVMSPLVLVKVTRCVPLSVITKLAAVVSSSNSMVLLVPS